MNDQNGHGLFPGDKPSNHSSFLSGEFQVYQRYTDEQFKDLKTDIRVLSKEVSNNTTTVAKAIQSLEERSSLHDKQIEEINETLKTFSEIRQEVRMLDSRLVRVEKWIEAHKKDETEEKRNRLGLTSAVIVAIISAIASVISAIV